MNDTSEQKVIPKKPDKIDILLQELQELIKEYKQISKPNDNKKSDSDLTSKM